jgi:hypothetical protein
MNYIIIFYNLFTTILQLVQQIYCFIISFIHFMRMDSKYPYPLQLIYNYFIICRNLNIQFATKYEVQGPNEAKNVFRCKTHFHKWGRV